MSLVGQRSPGRRMLLLSHEPAAASRQDPLTRHLPSCTASLDSPILKPHPQARLQVPAEWTLGTSTSAAWAVWLQSMDAQMHRLTATDQQQKVVWDATAFKWPLDLLHGAAQVSSCSLTGHRCGPTCLCERSLLSQMYCQS